MISTAKSKAREELRNFGIKKPSEIDVYKIAYGHRLVIDEENLISHQGRIFYNESDGVITINKDIKEKGKKNFTIAHELGHFLLDRLRNYLCKKYDIMMLKLKKDIENAANYFATELLMPEEWFVNSTGAIKDNVDCILEASEKFRVSLSAAAIRYSQIGKTPAAVIMTHKGKVKWSNMNELFDFQFVKKGYPVNQYTAVYDFYKGKGLNKGITPVESKSLFHGASEVSAEAWFLEDYNYKRVRKMGKEYYLKEQNIAMPNYNSVLTILWEK